MNVMVCVQIVFCDQDCKFLKGHINLVVFWTPKW